MADMLSNFVIRTSNMVLFPAVAAMQASAPEVRTRLLRSRRTMLLLVAIGLAGFVALSDQVILTLYDDRYEQAAIMLPLMLLGVWVAVLCTVNDSVLLGTAKPAYPAIANAAKLATFVIGVPIAFHYNGLLAALIVLNVGEVVRYVVLWFFSRRQHLAFGRDDLALTILFIIGVLAARELFWLVGLTGDLNALFPVLQPEVWAQ